MDRSRTEVIQKLKSKYGNIVAAGRDQGDVEISAPEKTRDRQGSKLWGRFVITVLLGIAIAGLVLGATHVIEWTVAVPITVGALGGIVAVAKFAHG